MTLVRQIGCSLITVGLLASLARADGDWQFTPKTAAQAAEVASYELYPTRVLEARLSYLDIHTGGNATGLELRLVVPMPYVIVPGLRIRDWFSIIRTDVPIVSLDTPMAHTVGISDTHIVDGTVIPFKWGALGFAFGVILPSATSAFLGTGKLSIGPGGGVAVVAMPHLLSFSVLFENQFSIAGDPMRKDVNVLFLQPEILLHLPRAIWLESQPILSFDWTRNGHATIPVMLGVGHGFSSRLAMSVEGSWIATGDGKNDGQVRLVIDYLGW
jgi:hypothetical protein